jgi:DMSO/TMAO reductase YedYZ molybdopterin-dependent catalytic subunit
MTLSISPSRRTGQAAGALCGLLGAGVAVGVGQLVAGVSVPAASPLLAVGQVSIGLFPPAVTDWAKQNLGTHDKTFLIAGVVVVLAVLAAVVGALAVRRRLAWGMAGLGVLALVGVVSALSEAGSSPGWAVPTLIGAGAGALVLRWLVPQARALAGPAAAGAVVPPAARNRKSAPPARGRAAQGRAAQAGGRKAAGSGPGRKPAAGKTSPAGKQPAGGKGSGLQPPDLPWTGDAGKLVPPDLPGQPVRPVPYGAKVPSSGAVIRPGDKTSARRTFLVASGATLAAAAAAEYGGRYLATRKNVSVAQAAVRFPRPAVPAPPLPAGAGLKVPGISPFITPNSSFYRVDTALVLPEVAPSTWQLRIHGMVDKEITVSFDELLRRPLIEDYITLTCVSNPVSGPYIGNAKWLGASLSSLLREAGIQSGASQLLCTSVDGFTSGTPVQVVMDGRDALVAVAMNGTALPVEHGFPARLVVPGLYGYVSATKWVTDIEVTTFADATAYWVQEGWAQQGPIKTESRIDVPASGSVVAPGRTAIAGVAWAQHKGIEAVEVKVDSGPWREATLAAVPDLDTWRQWVYEWDATPGNHTIQARATDKTGYTQTAVQEPTAPSGATGYPLNTVSVSS